MALINSSSAAASPQPGSTQPKEGPVGLKEYDVVDGHTGRETTLQLSDEDAEAMGLAGKHKKAPANKAAKAPANKAAEA